MLRHVGWPIVTDASDRRSACIFRITQSPKRG